MKEHNSLASIQLTKKLVYITTNYILTIIIQQPKQQLCLLENQMFGIHLIKFHEAINNVAKEIKHMLTKLLYENIWH